MFEHQSLVFSRKNLMFLLALRMLNKISDNLKQCIKILFLHSSNF